LPDNESHFPEQTVESKDLVELKIEKLVYGGDGLARLPADAHGPGKAVFVPFAIAGEQVEAEVVEQKPGFSRARLERVVEQSGERVTPGCPYFMRCGGCHYQHISYAGQLKTKSEILLETLQRTAKLTLPCELKVHGSPEWNYRNRTRLKVQSAPEFALGYYRFRSHELLPIEQCPISSPQINQAISELWTAGRAGKIRPEISEIEIFADHADERLLAEIFCAHETERMNARKIAETISQTSSHIAGVAVFEQPVPNQVMDPKKLAGLGDEFLEYRTNAAQYRVSAGGFFQANRFLIDELVRIVTGGGTGKLALDLYAGVGLFSTVLAKSFAQVIAVEASQISHSDLRKNVPREVKAVLATTEQYLVQAAGIRPDLVVADPPRGGLGENVVRALAKLDAPRMTYVSCDPSTLARDLRALIGLGYQVTRAEMIDLFPQTYHIESVFHLAR
jgi:23S rRNA (uracil1939-C5)-methyltransferase